MAFNPIAKFLPFPAGNSLVPIVALERPILPGQFWTSGLTLSPQLGWQGMLAAYAVSHTLEGAKTVLGLHRVPELELAVPVEGRDGFLVCQPRKPRLLWARRGLGMGLDFIGKAYLLGSL